MEAELPVGLSANDVRRVLVFVHGSGPQSLDVDLTPVTFPAGTQNLYFKDLAEAIRAHGIATIRYDKRAYEFKLRIEKNPSVKDSREFKRYAEHPLDYTIKDAEFFVQQASKSFPKAEIFILGHSEGTRVALEVAKQNLFVKGVVLIGFTNESISTAIFEQTAYRPLFYFTDADRDGNEVLNAEELAATAFKAQLPQLDLDQNGELSLDEFKAGNYSNLLNLDALYSKSYAMDEAKLDRASSVIRDAKFKILFLQGDWDNQTPSYFTRAVEIANRTTWKKANLEFHYVPKAGHALDPRDSRHDLRYRKLPAGDLKRHSEVISASLK